jgi:hypothetical protein
LAKKVTDVNYTDAVYIEGDFDESVNYAKQLNRKYKETKRPQDFLFWFQNRDYGFFVKNCGEYTMQVLGKGTLPNGQSVDDYFSQWYSVDMIPNYNMDNLQKLFGNKSSKYHEFQEKKHCVD